MYSTQTSIQIPFQNLEILVHWLFPNIPQVFKIFGLLAIFSQKNSIIKFLIWIKKSSSLNFILYNFFQLIALYFFNWSFSVYELYDKCIEANISQSDYLDCQFHVLWKLIEWLPYQCVSKQGTQKAIIFVCKQ